MNKRVYLVSGGFINIIAPLANHLGIPRECVYANTLLFDSTGEFAGVDTNQPTCRSGGKGKVVGLVKSTVSKWALPDAHKSVKQNCLLCNKRQQCLYVHVQGCYDWWWSDRHGGCAASCESHSPLNFTLKQISKFKRADGCQQWPCSTLSLVSIPLWPSWLFVCPCLCHVEEAKLSFHKSTWHDSSWVSKSILTADLSTGHALTYPPLQDTFIGFGGNVVREKVKAGAPWYVYNFQELIDELVVPTVAGMTRAKRLALTYVNGMERERKDQKLQEEWQLWLIDKIIYW